MIKTHGSVYVINFYFVTSSLPPFIFSGTRRGTLCLQTYSFFNLHACFYQMFLS